MELSKKAFALLTICHRAPKIDPTPDYQRPPAWTNRQKQLLMDTIFRNYDIPKFYFRKVKRDDGIEHEVIDGQQRLRAIWEFADDGFSMPKDADPVGGHPGAGLTFSRLPSDVVELFHSYQLDIVEITDAVEDDKENEVRDMFLRLQNGTTLKAQEKRNAMVGAMRDFVRATAGHPFFGNCDFADSRYAFQHVAAQLVLIELNGGPTNVKDADLNRMYREHAGFDAQCAAAKKVAKTLGFLQKAFPRKTPELRRYNAVALHALASVLIEKYVTEDLAPKLSSWFIGFEALRATNDAKPEDEKDYSLIDYRRLTSQSTDAEESIRGRLEVMERRFFGVFPDIELKDAIRVFSHEQRLAIYRRDGGTCRLRITCDGMRVPWGNWHADHVLPHSRGGRTIVENGQIACPSCNLSKGASVPAA